METMQSTGEDYNQIVGGCECFLEVDKIAIPVLIKS